MPFDRTINQLKVFDPQGHDSAPHRGLRGDTEVRLPARLTRRSPI